MSEQASATDKGSFFSLLGHSFQMIKQHWLTFLILVVLSFIVTVTSVAVAVGVGFGAMLVGGSTATIALVLIVSLVIAAVSMLISLSTLKVVHLTISNHEVKIGEILSYGLKNFLSFIWAIIAGVVYAVRWGLILVLGGPSVYAIINVSTSLVATTESGISAAPLAMLSAVNFGLVVLGLVGIIILIWATVRIVFLGIAFVADDKRGTEAAKMSIELVKGRWLKTFGYLLFAGLLLTIGHAIIISIIGSVVGPEIGEIVSNILAQVVAIVMVIFSALLYRSYKKTDINFSGAQEKDSAVHQPHGLNNMKKILLILLLLVIVFSVYAVKLGDTNNPKETEVAVGNTKNVENVEKTAEVKSFITLTFPSNKSAFDSSPVVIRGKVSPNVKKIEVKAVGGEKGYCDVLCSPYYEDVYTLDSFKAGDETFSYGARSDWKNLAQGYNSYNFTAYFDDGTTATTGVTLYYDPSKIQYGDNSYGAIAEVSKAVKEFAGVSDASVYIDENFNNKYVIGTLINNQTLRFWAAKQDSSWKIVVISKFEERVNCSEYAAYNFPPALIKDCSR